MTASCGEQTAVQLSEGSYTESYKQAPAPDQN